MTEGQRNWDFQGNHLSHSAESIALAYMIARRSEAFGVVDVVERKKKMPHHRYPGESLTTSAERNALAY